jgi:hypothetical protein
LGGGHEEGETPHPTVVETDPDKVQHVTEISTYQDDEVIEKYSNF